MTDEWGGAPVLRKTNVNEASVHADRDYVLYWMIAQRRTRWNFALDEALAWADRLDRPLLVLEALRIDYAWASERIHRFVVEGMVDNAARFEEAGVAYHPYVEPEAGAGRGLLDALAVRACVVVTDEFPCFFLPNMVRAAGRKLDVRLLQVDSNGVLPLRAMPAEFPTAYSFRRFLQRTLPDHLLAGPRPEPLSHSTRRTTEIPATIRGRWPAAPVSDSLAAADFVCRLPISSSPDPVSTMGGSVAGERTLETFVRERLARYGEGRNDPDDDVASGLSPYLHFGHVSAHEAMAAVLDRDDWTPLALSTKANGHRSGWWGLRAESESFLDELITWRELGYAFSFHRPNDYDRYETLPDWAKNTLEAHAADPRPVVYTIDELEEARTHDPVWNAAQRQLLREGRIHNYLRMLWGKKVLEWSTTPREAAARLIELNNRWALDGRNPNSYSGIYWVLGRFDRPWGPERRIYGTIRYMSSDNTVRKLRMKDYLERHGDAATPVQRGLFDDVSNA